MRISPFLIVTTVLLVVAAAVLAVPVLIYTVMRGPADKHLFDYGVETVLAFDIDGTRVEARQVSKCEVLETGGGFVDVGSNPRRVDVRRRGGDNLHVVLPDGSALILWHAPLCRWTVLPAAGAVETLMPIGDEPLPKGVAPEQVMWGDVAWLDNATVPRVIMLTKLGSLAKGEVPRIRNLEITQHLSDAAPDMTMANDVPVFAEIARMNAALKKGGSPEQKRDTRSLTGLRVVDARLSTADDDAVCRTETAPFAGKTGWSVIGGHQACLGKNSTAVGVDIGGNVGRLRLDLAPEQRPMRLAFSRAALIAAGVNGSFSEETSASSESRFSWMEVVCVEGQCLDVPLVDGQNNFIELYHPATNRLVRVTIQTEWLTNLLQ